MSRRRSKPTERNSDPSAWLDALGVKEAISDVVPPGWKSIPEIAEMIGYSCTYTSKLIRDKYEAGEIEGQRFRVKCPKSRQARPRMLYFLKQ